MINRAIVSFCVGLILSGEAIAGPRDKDFFERNYARGIKQEAPTGAEMRSDNSKKSSPTAIHDSESSHTAPSLNPQGLPAAPGNGTAIESQSKGKRERIEVPRVELFVNSVETDHVNQVVARAVSLHNKGRIFLIGISHIGDYRTLSIENRAELEQLKIRYTAAPSVMYGEHIKQSPTWAFVSQNGARLVEGCLDPERYIDTNGAEPPTMKLDAMNKQEDSLAGL